MNKRTSGQPITSVFRFIYDYLVTHRTITLLLFAAAATVAIRILFHIEIHSTAVLYVAVPFFIALGLIVFTRSPQGEDLRSSYLRLMRESMIVFLATSVFLHEGFLCVLFFIPIYIVVVTIVFIIAAIYNHAKSSTGKLYSSILPALVIASSIEGVIPEFTFPTRYNVSTTHVIPLTPEEIRHNLVKPMHIDRSDNAMLSMFPMPYRIDAGSLEEGDVHRIYYRYDKWVFTNSHEGIAELLVAHADEHNIEMEVLNDTSYISSYMQAIGTRINMVPVDDKHTQVTLTITYDRLLSPAWYFGPLESYAMKKMSELLLKEVIANG